MARQQVAVDVSVRWGEDILFVRRVTTGAARDVAGLDPSIVVASVDRGRATAHVPDGMRAEHRAGSVTKTIDGPASIALAEHDSIALEAGAFTIAIEASNIERARPKISLRGFGAAPLHVALVALLQGVLLLSGRAAFASGVANDDDDPATMRSYLLSSEAPSKTLGETRVEDGGEGTTRQVNGRDGDGREGGGAMHRGVTGAMGSPLSHVHERREYAAPERDVDLPEPRSPSLDDAGSFGMIGLLASMPRGAAFGEGAGGSERRDPYPATGSMAAMWTGEAYGSYGLGLTGIGEGGGGRGEGIGLGTIGTWGRTNGTPGPGSGGRADKMGIGQGFSGGWGGHLIGSHHAHAIVCRFGGGDFVSGRLPPEAIRRVVRQNFGRFRACYENGLTKDPALAGRVATRFLIDHTGRVVSSASAGSDLASRDVVSCVTKAFTTLEFPEPEGGTVTVVYPIVFSTE